MIVAISDCSLFISQDAFKTHIINLVKSDVDYIIIREKHLSDDVLTQCLLDIMSSAGAKACQKLIINTKAQVARHLGLTQVHLPEAMFETIRLSHTRYSYAIHDNSKLKDIEDSALFVTLSPIFKTSCKPNAQPLDEDIVQSVLKHSKVPVVALGGIDQHSVETLKKMGFKSVGMRTALMDTKNYLSTIDLYKQNGF